MLRPGKLRRRYVGIIAVTAIALLSGCRHAPLSYQLVRHGFGTLLIPPAQIVDANSPTFDFTIRNARQESISNSSCDIAGELIALHWQGRAAQITVNSAAYSIKTLGGDAQKGNLIPLDPLQNLEKFRNDLETLKSKNCLTRDEGRRLKTTLSEKLPLPPDAAYRFRFGTFDVTGIFDLGADFRLQIVTPVYSGGANDPAKQTIGFETAFYIFTAAQKDDRVQISLASVTETTRGKTPAAKSAPQTPLNFPEGYRYFRIVFRTDANASDHITIATILSATDKKILEEATRQHDSGPVDSCDAVVAAGNSCMIFPPKVGVGPELRVHVNGQEAFVQIGGDVSDAIGFNKPLNEIEKTLQVHRLFQGHLIPITFDRTSRDILNFVLMPGDEITW
jgi:hypothetical protein